MELFPSGLGIHHAGMLRKHRTLMERAFEKGYIKVGDSCHRAIWLLLGHLTPERPGYGHVSPTWLPVHMRVYWLRIQVVCSGR